MAKQSRILKVKSSMHVRKNNKNPIFIFEYAFDHFEVPLKGYFGGCKVRLFDGHVYPVFFYDPVRLAQDLKAEMEMGTDYIAEKGMIIVSKVTLKNMERAVKQLANEGYFAGLKPLE